MSDGSLTIGAEPLRDFTHAVFEACGAPSDAASDVGELLVWANLRGGGCT